MSEQQQKKTQLECRHALYFKATDYSNDDILLINEKIHYPDGQIRDNLRILQNYEKEIYIHKEAFRKYTQKKVWKPKSEMDVYRTTEANLEDTIKRALNLPMRSFTPRRKLFRNPYIYRADLPSTTIIKKKYKDIYPDAISNASVAVLDIETDVIWGTEEIIAIALSFKDKAIIATTKKFIGDIPDPKYQFETLLDKLTPEVRRPKEKGTDNRGCDVEFVVAETPADAVKRVFKRAHEWKPDFIVGWNLMDFDIPRILSCLEKEGYKPEDYLCDPRIPEKYKQCKYIQGVKVKKTDSGKIMPKAAYEQWHTLQVPATFYFLDAMCVYYLTRMGSGLEENYKLDTILNKWIGRGKVGIPEAEHLEGIDQHKFMQTEHKIAYLVYNLFDCIGIEMLDEKTGDISRTFPVLSGNTDYQYYNSNPRRLCDAMAFFIEENPDFNGVFSTVSDEMHLPVDDLVPSLDNWIVALPTERLLDNGIDIIEELPGHPTKVRAQSFDVDITSSYPNGEISMNLSKDTTMHELNRIEGFLIEEQRQLGLNMLGGRVNSMNFARKVYKLPEPEVAYQLYLKSKGLN